MNLEDGKAKVAKARKEPMQGRLIGNRASDPGGAATGFDVEAVEPV